MAAYQAKNHAAPPGLTLSLAAWILFYLGRFPGADNLPPRDTADVLGVFAGLQKSLTLMHWRAPCWATRGSGASRSTTQRSSRPLRRTFAGLTGGFTRNPTLLHFWPWRNKPCSIRATSCQSANAWWNWCPNMASVTRASFVSALPGTR